MNVLAELALLETRGLLRLNALDSGTEYEFRHNLLQATAYRSLLRDERRRLHEAAGEVLENLYAGRIESQAGRLAEHFSQANRKEKALEYSAMAGSEALRVHAYGGAVGHYLVAGEFAQS